MSRPVVSTLHSVFAATAIGVLAFATNARGEEKYLLAEPADDIRIFGVGARIELTGQLETAVEKEKSVALPIHLSAALSFRERRLVGTGGDAESLRSVRDYEQTQADIQVAGEKSNSKLSDALKLVVAQGQAEGVQLHSLDGPLTANELDLLRMPGDPLALKALLPKSEVAIGEKWSPPTWAVSLLAGIDAVVKSEFTCELASVKDSVARVKIAGTLSGATDGAKTEISITGFYEYDLKVKSISLLEVSQSEKRSIGIVSPGLDVAARVKLLRKPALVPGRLGDETVISRAALPVSAAQLALRYETDWGISLSHRRNWHLFKEDAQQAIFRLVDDGALICQCNLALVPAVAAGKRTSPEEFQADIRQSLGDRLASLDGGKSLPAVGGRVVFTVRAESQPGTKPVVWQYYLLTDPSGRQVSFVFSFDPAESEKLAGRDLELVNALVFLPIPGKPSR